MSHAVRGREATTRARMLRAFTIVLSFALGSKTVDRSVFTTQERAASGFQSSKAALCRAEDNGNDALGGFEGAT
jgi:hypothetical protein